MYDDIFVLATLITGCIVASVIIAFLALTIVGQVIDRLNDKMCEKCYSKREQKGEAAFGRCGGVVGGTRATGFLSEKCVSCPHFNFPIDRME